jgi:HK97 family phage major capsid protein
MTEPINTRTTAGALVPTEESQEIIKATMQESMALATFKRVPIVTNEKTFPVTSTLPTAAWTNPVDTGVGTTTKMEWDRVTMKVADMIVLAPMPANVIDDVKASGNNLTEEMRPYLAQAAGMAIDAAIFFGTSKPTEWSSLVAMLDGCAAVANTVDPVNNPTGKNTWVSGTMGVKQGGFAGDINRAMRLLASQGYRPSALAARSTFEFDLDNVRDDNGQKLLDIQKGTYGGRPIRYGGDGVFPAEAASVAQMFMYDASKFLIGIRKDMEFQIFTEGVIHDPNDGKVLYNLMTQDGVVVRLKLRIGYAVANPVTTAQTDEAKRYPAVALLQGPAGV